MSAATDMTDDLWDDMADEPWMDPSTGREAHTLRVQAAEADCKAAESWESSDTDGFVSQWAHGLSADRDRLQASLLESGGVATFLNLFDLAGQYVPARIIETRYGKRWMILTPEGRPSGQFAPVLPKRRDTLAKRGLLEGYAWRPAAAVIDGTGHGLSGRAWVAVVATDQPTDEPMAVLTADRWAV